MEANDTRISFLGIKRQGSKAILRAVKSINMNSSEFTVYLNAHGLTKAKLRKPKNRKAILEYLQEDKQYADITSIRIEEDKPMYERKPIPDYKRIQYLEKLEAYIDRHYNTWFALHNMINMADEFEFDINDFMKEQYPFRESYDDLFFMADKWLSHFAMLVMRQRKALQSKVADNHYHANAFDEETLQEPEAEYHGVIDGRKFISCSIHYENITIRDDEGKVYYLPPETLLVALNEFLFMVEKKRTRTWLKPLVSDRVEEDSSAYGYLERESEARMKEILRLRAIIRNSKFSATFIEEVYTEQTGGGCMVDIIKLKDMPYIIGVTDDVICLYKNQEGAFEDGNELGHINIPIVDENITEEPKAPYYKLETVRDKWVCAFDTVCGGWDCVRHHGGELDGYPYLYDSKEAVESDEFFDKDNDFAFKADMFVEGRRVTFTEHYGFRIEGEYIAR